MDLREETKASGLLGEFELTDANQGGSGHGSPAIKPPKLYRITRRFNIG